MAVTNSLDIKIKADATKAVASLEQLNKTLEEVRTSMSSIDTTPLKKIREEMQSIKNTKVKVDFSGSGSGGGKSGGSGGMAQMSSLLKTLTTDSSKANSSFLGLNSTLVKMAASWGVLNAAIYPAKQLFSSIWDASESAMDYVETYNYFSVTMDKMGSEAGESFNTSFLNELKELDKKMTGFSLGDSGELLETYSKNLGADANALLDYQATIGAVTNSVGLLTDQSIAAQKSLSMLAQDLSSLTNEDLTTVMTNLQSGLIGMSRALYKYGIDITNNTLKEYARAEGITKSVSAMSQSEKMQLRLLAILDQSKVAWGDMANTVNSVANQYRIFSQSVSNLSRVFGQLFLPIVQKVLPYINAFLIALRQVFTLLGFKIYGNSWLSDLMDGISSGYSGSDVAADLEDIADAEDDATSSAKKLKQATMGIDELNIINTTSSNGSSSGSSGGGSIDLTDSINDALADYEAIWNKAFEDATNNAQTLANRFIAAFKNALKDNNFYDMGKSLSDSLANMLNRIDWDSIFSGARNFGHGLATYINGLVQPSTFYAVGRTVANALNTAIYTAFEMGKELDFDKIGKAIGKYWNAIFENFDFSTFGQTIGLWVGGITATISNALTSIKWDELFDGVKSAISGFFKGFFENATIGDVAIVLGALTIKKIATLKWGATAIKLISQTLAKGLAERIGIDIASDATLGAAISTGLTSSLSSALTKWKNASAALKFDGWDNFTFSEKATLAFGETASSALSMAKTITGVVSMIGGIALSLHEFFDMWSDGWNGASEVLKDVGIALAALGAVMAGICTGGIAVLVAALAGVGSTAIILAHDQLPQIGDTIKEVLTTPGGIDIATACQDVADQIASVGDGFIEISNKSAELETARTNASEAASSIETIALKMQEGAITVEEGTSQIQSAFAQLKSAADTYVLGTEDVLLAAFGSNGAFAQAYEEMGYDIDNTTSVIIQNTSDAQQELQALQDEINSGDVTVGSERYSEIVQRMLELSGNTDEASKAIEDFDYTMDGVEIDYSKLVGDNGSLDTEYLETTLNTITDSVNSTSESVQNASSDAASALNDAISQASDPEKIATLTETLNALPEAVGVMNSDIQEKAQSVTDAMQNQLLGKLTDEINQAITDWDNMNWWEKLMSRAKDADSYAQKRANEFKTQYIDPVSDEIETSFESLGVNGAGWGSEASTKIINSIFDTEIYGAGQYTTWSTTLKDNYQQAIDDALKDLPGYASESGKDVIVGFNNGITENTDSTKSTMENLSTNIKNAFHDASGLALGSPSRTMIGYGKDTVDGFNLGIQQNQNSTKTYIANWQKTIVTNFGEAWSDSYKNMTKVWDDCASYFTEYVLTPTETAFSTTSTNLADILTQTNTNTIEGATNTFDTLSQNYTNFFEQFNTSFTTAMNNAKKTAGVGINSIISIFESGVNKMADGVNSFIRSADNAMRKVAKETGTSFGGFSTIGNVSMGRVQISAYANGGFPEDGLFMANSTELVGQFSNGQNVVANNEQIISGVASGVQQGVRQAVEETMVTYLADIANNTQETANKDFSVSIGDKAIAKANKRGQRKLGMALRTV